MVKESTLGALSHLSSGQLGVFRGCDAVAKGVSRKQLAALARAGAVARVLPDTYRMTAIVPSAE